MKKLSLGIFAVVLAIGFSAFTSKSLTESNQSYVWHKYNAAGTAELSPVVKYTGTTAGARASFGCSDAGAVNCARAYDAEGIAQDVYIKKVPQ